MVLFTNYHIFSTSVIIIASASCGDSVSSFRNLCYVASSSTTSFSSVLMLFSIFKDHVHVLDRVCAVSYCYCYSNCGWSRWFFGWRSYAFFKNASAVASLATNWISAYIVEAMSQVLARRLKSDSTIMLSGSTRYWMFSL